MPDNTDTMLRAKACAVGMLLVLCAVSAFAQTGFSDQTYWIFLRNGESLPSFGDYAVVADRVVFTLPLGEPGPLRALQLMSLPAADVDLDRTSRYADGLRAARYAATRGEADYLAMTDEVARALDQLRDVEDPARRLALAEEARRRLVEWSGANYAYRVADIRELAALFDQVIGQLRAAAGESTFALDLSAGLETRVYEPLRPAPDFDESIALALGAARAADVADERKAVLSSARALLNGRPGAEPMLAAVTRELSAESAADAAYASLEADILARSEAAVALGDASAINALRTAVASRDAALGGRRPHLTAALLAILDERVAAAVQHRMALDQYAVARSGRLAYERTVRPLMSGLDGLKPTMEAIRDLRGTAFWRLERAIGRLAALTTSLEIVAPPDDLADVHATLVSAFVMAGQSLERWRVSAVTGSSVPAAEASTAAAGSLLLAARTRVILVERLFPPAPPASPRSAGSR